MKPLDLFNIRHGPSRSTASRDWYFMAEQPAPAPHLAHPGGCAALSIVLVTVLRVSGSCEHFPDGFDLHILLTASKGLVLCLARTTSLRHTTTDTHPFGPTCLHPTLRTSLPACLQLPPRLHHTFSPPALLPLTRQLAPPRDPAGTVYTVRGHPCYYSRSLASSAATDLMSPCSPTSENLELRAGKL